MLLQAPDQHIDPVLAKEGFSLEHKQGNTGVFAGVVLLLFVVPGRDVIVFFWVVRHIFDKVFGVNSLQFADDAAEVLRAVRERMRSGATIAITQQSRKSKATDQDSIRAAERIGELLEANGFGAARIHTLPLKPVCAACVLAVAQPVV